MIKSVNHIPVYDYMTKYHIRLDSNNLNGGKVILIVSK